MSRKTFPLLAALLSALLIIPAAANAATGPVNVTEAPADPSSSTRFEFSETAAPLRVPRGRGRELDGLLDRL